MTSNQSPNDTVFQQQNQRFGDSLQPTQTNVDGVRREYSPLQYQETNTNAPPTTIEDFEENLLNSLMYSVDESTEREILKNLNISDELLASCALTGEKTSLDKQSFTGTDAELFDDKIFDQIQESETFDCQPEAQQLLEETRNDLEKELLMFREIKLHEPQQSLTEAEGTSSDIMKLSQKSPKYVNHAKLDDHLLYK
jgi:hypothetical protein